MFSIQITNLLASCSSLAFINRRLFGFMFRPNITVLNWITKNQYEFNDKMCVYIMIWFSQSRHLYLEIWAMYHSRQGFMWSQSWSKDLLLTSDSEWRSSFLLIRCLHLKDHPVTIMIVFFPLKNCQESNAQRIITFFEARIFWNIPVKIK